MEINRQLNLVVRVETTGGTVFVHHTPVGRAIFEKYYSVIGKTFGYIFAEGLSIMAGPAVAFLALKDYATERNQWEGPAGVAFGLVAEMERLTNVLVSTEQGWNLVPFADAVTSKLLDDDAAAEVRGQITFFTCVWLAAPKATREQTVRASADLWASEITALDCSAYRNSLPISTPAPLADIVSASAIPS